MEEPQPQRTEGQVEDATAKANGKVAAKAGGPEPMEIDETGQPKGEDKSKQNQGTQEVDLEEKRRLECLDNMEKIEKEFSILKEKFYADKISHLKTEIDKISEGKHDKYQQKMKDLDKRKEEKVWAAEQWKQYQLMNINNVFEAEKKMAEDEFQSEKDQLKEKMVVALQDKQKKLEEEKNNLNLTDGLVDMRSAPAARSLRRRGK
jgi:breast cancer metastasis-suppressor 1-like protein